MSHKNLVRTLCLGSGVLFLSFFTSSCSNKKNTAVSRLYHSVNTRYNIHYNADVAYKEALEAKEKNNEEKDNLSQLLYIFPQQIDSASLLSPQNFTTTIDKTTKAIKLHSIKTKPQRDPNKRNDAEYQAWLQQREFTPFMDNVWLLLAKAEFQEGNYLKSITTFLYITKIYSSRPEIVTECQLWIARAYTEMGWMYEAGNILHKIELAGGAPEKQKGLYSLVKANYLVYNKDFNEAIPHLEYAIRKEVNSRQKLRMKYLLGQLYANMGDKIKADKAFASVKGMSTPYKYTFNAQLQQIHLDDSQAKTKAISSLNKMTRSSKNKDFLDQIYYTIGNIYLEKQDSIKAIENYRKAIEKSTRNGYDKAVCQIKLGDIYFTQQEFVLAQPCYSEALAQLLKSHNDYPRVALRSEVLDELVVHVKTVYEQDSLQHLAQLPEAERLQIINNKIEELKKQDEAERKAEEHQKRIEEQSHKITSWDDMGSEPLFTDPSAAIQKQPTVPMSQQGADGSSFYFYNVQAVNQGKIAFQKQWGNRKLEDDWRRRNKVSAISDFADLDTSNKPDSVSEISSNNLLYQGIDIETPKKITEDLYSVDYYMQQLPLTAEAIQESNILIENALFNMGNIYKDKLEDMSLAIDAFSTDINRFPQTPNLEEIYYQLFLIYMRIGNDNMMSLYRSKLLSEFPLGRYANPLSEPDYEWNFKHMANLQDSLYDVAYTAYLKADTETVRNNYHAMKTKYPFTNLMPNFALLNALSYAQTKDAKGLGENLEVLVKEYPKSDVTPLATDILNKIKAGKVILSDGSPITDFNWNKAYERDSILLGENAKPLQYSDTLDVPHLLLLMFKPKTIDRNELLYQVADYNFSNYVIQTFDLNFDTDPPYEVLQMKGFKSFAAMKSYMSKAFNEGGLIQHLDTSILVIPISIDNYTYTLPRLGLDKYMLFFKEHFKEQLPQLVSYWDGYMHKIEEQPKLSTPKNEVEATPQQPEITKEVKNRPSREPVIKIEQNQPQKPVNDKEINADDLLTKDQLNKVGKLNDIVNEAENILNNPVDGIKNLFDKYKNREKLTKEEKAALKEEDKLRKQQEEEQKLILKARQDSINKIDKAKVDSISKAEKAVEDSVKAVKRQEEIQKRKEKEQQENAAKIASEEREKARKEKERTQKERLRQREQERKEKEKNREQERKEKEKQNEQKRKQRTNK